MAPGPVPIHEKDNQPRPVDVTVTAGSIVRTASLSTPNREMEQVN